MDLRKETNLRNLTITTESGKDVKNTKMLSGKAGESAASRERNKTEQFYVQAPPTGGAGMSASHK